MTTTVEAPPQGKQAPVARRPALQTDRVLAAIGKHSILIALGIMFLAPFAFVTLTALMSSDQALTSQLWPRSWHPENFVEAFQKAPLFRYLVNTLFYSVLGTLFMLLSSIPAAYALARLQWRGRGISLVAVLCVMMLPPQVTVVPVFLLWANADLTGTLWPLIIPMLLGDAFSIFLLRQFLVTIPTEYTDAARVDGCSEWQVMLRVILPMAKPAVAAAAMFQFFYCWNDYYGPLLYTNHERDNWTLSIGLATFRNLHQVEWNLVMAATLLVLLPVLVVFFLAQKAFVQGVTMTGVKG
ncbi:carbohydrate ABC transporter permease [Pseudonocardia sp. TRM90224]|uniref:carbohydrate ABC transporter permease n=1 Tax=Pseudonocardia sp. TRM90224 TaxID=2812678 RepID=UPI001E2E03C7|nr:carbohydrate ABC transporter permease [Pseudonocardia sp. TRM90224]